MRERVDLVVVGGGPGGSAAAEAAMRENPGMSVVLLEKRDRPHGTCAGGVGFNWCDEMRLQIPEHIKEVRVDEVAIYGPTEEAVIEKAALGVDALGWVVDRWGFDEWLLCKAAAAGANVMRSTTFNGIERSNGSWIVTAANEEGKFELEAKYVVDASGPSATVAKRLGLKVHEEKADIHVGLQWTVPLPDHRPLERLDLWFKRDKTPEAPWAVRSGYVWSFPSRHPYWHGQSPPMKGRFTRIGIGVDMENNAVEERSAKRCLEDFRACNPDFAGSIMSENGGLIPTGKPLQTAWENVFVVGDAGRHVSALHGGGIWFARVAGEEAGKTAAIGGDAASYDKAWKKRIGWTLTAHYALKKVLYELSNDEIDVMVRELARFEVGSANPMVEIPKAALALAKHPRLGSKMAVKGFLQLVKASS